MNKKNKLNTNNKKINNEQKQNNFFQTKEVVGVVIITAIVSFFIGLSFKQKDNNQVLEYYETELLSNYRYILKNYYKDINAENLASVAIKGMIEYLDDPYADYIDINDIDDFNILIHGEYQGIGVQITYNDNYEPTISYVFPNSPASKNGLKVGDVIVEIGEEIVTNKSLEEIRDLVTNFGYMEFNVTYKRESNTYQTKLKKNKIVIESVESKFYENGNKKIGYLMLDNFADNSYEQFNSDLVRLENQNIDSLIIDLRNNTGGQLYAVDNIVSLFINKNKVIYQMKEQDKITKYYSKQDNNRKYPIVVLVNENSASASELMTAALKEVYGATIIGTKTYGKGTAQEIRTLDNGEQYKFTTKEWLTAKGNLIEGIGIEPTIEIKQSEKYYMEQNEENDTQLQYAIDFLCK